VKREGDAPFVSHIPAEVETLLEKGFGPFEVSLDASDNPQISERHADEPFVTEGTRDEETLFEQRRRSRTITLV
jgi:hypothetical protein